MAHTHSRTRHGLTAALVALAVLAAAGEAAARETLEQVRARIERDGLHWTAGETSRSELAPGEWRSMLGTLADGELLAGGGGHGSTPFDVHPDAPVVDTLAGRFSWADVDGEDWTTEIKDQGACGSCAVFASTAGAEARANVSAGVPDLDLDLAEQNLLSCTSASTCQSGTWDTQILIPTLIAGIPDESCHPYEAVNGSCADACGAVADRSFPIVGGAWLPSVSTMLDIADPADIRAALVAGPVMVSFVVPEDFSYYTGGVYDGTPTPAELISAWHTVLVVGWDDHADDDLPPSWLVKNSWGTEWGDDGWFEIVRDGATRFGTQATALEVDASVIDNWLCVEGDDDLVVELETGSGATATRTVELSLCKGEGPVTFKVESRWPLTWLAVSPMDAQVTAEAPVQLTLTYSEAAYEAGPSTGEWNRLYVVAPHGHTRRVYTELWSIPPAADGDADGDTDADADADSDADVEGADDSEGDSGCGCRAVAARDPASLVEALLALLSR
jgi:hypothetical protein